MGDSKNAELASTKAMNVLLELQKSVNTVLASLNELKSRIKAIEDQIMRDSEPKQDYLKETIDTVGKMLEENGGIPVSKTDIAARMGLSDSTIYFRCEKLVETGKIKKF
ncbi:MAG: winged helix-turn-helix transcriptional regulator, partial [Candidatus Hodarchaeota archaeon]